MNDRKLTVLTVLAGLIAAITVLAARLRRKAMA